MKKLKLVSKMITKIGFLSLITVSTAMANIISFGDSITDSGNNHWVKTAGKIGTPITNSGRENKNPPIWLNFLVAQLMPTNELYFSTANKKLNPLVDNISYAWASAETGLHYINDDAASASYPIYNDAVCLKHGPGKIQPGNVCVPGIQLQVNQFLQDVHYRSNSNTIFILWAGGNDIMNNLMKLFFSKRPVELLLKTVSTSQDKISDISDLSFPIINLFKAKNELINAGVSPNQIYVIELPDSSKFPAMKRLSKINPQIKNLIHAVSSLFNSNLIEVMTKGEVNHNLLPSHIISVNDLLDEIMSHAEEMGFNNITDSCVEKNKAPTCEGYLFFDDLHPTIKSGELIGLHIAKKFKIN